MRTKALLKPLRRLRQPKARAQIHQKRSRTQRHRKGHHRRGRDLAHAMEVDGEQDDENEERNGLEGQAGEEDVVGGGGVFAVAFGAADAGGSGDLDDGGDDVADDEEDEKGAGGEGRVLPADGVDEEGEDGVDRGGEEDGRDDWLGFISDAFTWVMIEWGFDYGRGWGLLGLVGDRVYRS